MTTRRVFIKRAGAGLLAMGASPLSLGAEVRGAIDETGSGRDLFKLSVAGYTFRQYDLDDALKIMQRTDIHYLCIKDFHLPLDSTDDAIAAFHLKLSAAKVAGYAVGPIYMKSEAEADRAFEYAKRVGVRLIVGVPNYELLPYVDTKVRAYDFRYAIHIHGPDMELYPTAEDVMLHVEKLDPRIGLCLDIAHDTRAGFDPVADLKRYHRRIFDIHLNDATAAAKEGKLCELGRGVIDFPAFVKILRKVKYSGCCSIELTSGKEETPAALAESAGYFRGIMDAVK
ncbi:MAG: sugar phosphate isomerase/epimerase [Bacteroidales bacterium]|jgi:sugar phosphate isomerase/epimerase|nr:sugar phosphate isomerase/epimerase [Bacteroidales bacterium]